MGRQSAESIPVGDKGPADSKTAAPPKFEYSPSPGDYRQSMLRSAVTLAEADTFQFHDLKLPENKDLLAVIKQASSQMTDEAPALQGKLPDGSVLALRRDKGHLGAAALIRPDGSSDTAYFDANMNATSEIIKTAIGTRGREFGPNGTIKVESNATTTYADKLEFDDKGKLVHSHSETPTDIKDDRRNADGSGVQSEKYTDADPLQSFSKTATTKADGSVVADQKFGDGNYMHIEIDKDGHPTKFDQSDLKHGKVNHFERGADGEMKETVGIMT